MDGFFKKGDLEVTILEARGLKNGEAANAFCVVKLKMNKTFKTTVAKAPDPKWNQSVKLDLMSLNDEELLIKVMEQRRLAADHFLGQVQIPIKALQLETEPEWFFLSDAPAKGGSNLDVKSKRLSTAITSTVITGEVKVKLTFVHRFGSDKPALNGATPMMVASPNDSSPVNGNTPPSYSPVPMRSVSMAPSSPAGRERANSSPDKKDKRRSISSDEAASLASVWGKSKAFPARGVSSIASIESSPPPEPSLPIQAFAPTPPVNSPPVQPPAPPSVHTHSNGATPSATPATPPVQPAKFTPVPFLKVSGMSRHVSSTIGPLTDNHRGLSKANPQLSASVSQIIKPPSKEEQVMIDEALKEKQMEVEKRIKQGRELIHHISVRIQKSDAESADIPNLKKKMEMMETNLKQMEDAYKTQQGVTKEPTKTEWESARHDGTKRADEKKTDLDSARRERIDERVSPREKTDLDSARRRENGDHDSARRLERTDVNSGRRLDREEVHSARRLEREELHSARRLEKEDAVILSENTKLSAEDLREDSSYIKKKDRKTERAKERERERELETFKMKEVMLERERNKEKEENTRLKAKVAAVEVQIAMLEQQLESEKKHNELLSKQYHQLEVDVQKKEQEELLRTREDKEKASRDEGQREKTFRFEMKCKELEMKLRDAERAKEEYKEGAKKIEEGFTRKLKDLEDEIMKRDAKQRKKVELERDQLSKELSKVIEEQEKMDSLSKEEAEAAKLKKAEMETRLKEIEGALEKLRAKKHQMDVDRLEQEVRMKEQKLKEGEERLLQAIEMTKEESEKEKEIVQEELLNHKTRRDMAQETEELEKSRRTVIERVKSLDEQVQAQIARQKHLEILLFEKKSKATEDRLNKMKEKEKELQNMLVEDDWLEEDDWKEEDDLWASGELKRPLPENNASILKEKEELDKKRAEMHKKMMELEDELSKEKKERDGALIRRRKKEVDNLENKIKKMGEAVVSIKERTERISKDASSIASGSDDGGYASSSESDDEITRDLTKKDSEESGLKKNGSSLSVGNGSGKRKHKSQNSQAETKFDALVEKLNKLDKLDDLLSKLNTMNMSIMNGGSGDVEEKRSYADLKAEMEALQKVIFNDSITGQEREDANIKFEKVLAEVANTPEYKAEIAALEEEKRKLNEPLNKAALERMMRLYSSDNLRKNEDLRERLKQNPELQLIGADPKIILAKHQNDFGNYFLRNLDLDELRAIRASLPKFRRDQKRQQEWSESLEGKIEATAREQAEKIKIKPKPPPKLGSSNTLSPPRRLPKPASTSSGDIFSELLMKRAQLG